MHSFSALYVEPLLDDMGAGGATALKNYRASRKWRRHIWYVLNLWPALLRYCNDGLIEIDNSAPRAAGTVLSVAGSSSKISHCAQSPVEQRDCARAAIQENPVSYSRIY